MKNLIFVAILLLTVSALSLAQPAPSANATATGTIITPLAIAKSSDMNFGNVVAGATPGTVVLAPAGTRTITGGAFLPATVGTVSAASFNVTGANNFTYAITLPASSITITSGANTMTIDTWTSNPTPTGLLNGSGAQTVTVGGTLNVAANQAAGTYTLANGLTVIVAYN